MRETKCPRLLFAGGGSGSGKTLITCGIMAALKARGFHLGSLKCGPDFIDPMFHRTVIGSISGNIDSFFMDQEMMRYQLAQMGAETDIVIMEGVMGYYDGVSGSFQGSSWEIGNQTNTPVILIFNGRGMGHTMIPQIKGLIEYQKPNTIKGIILNQVSEKIYQTLADRIKQECGIPVLGYVPIQKDFFLESRHLGLKMPCEIQDIRNHLMELGKNLEKTIQIDQLLDIGLSAKPVKWNLIEYGKLRNPLFLSVAKDDAFCFLYRENIDFLEKIGVSIQYFSPLHDQKLPENTQAILLPGGYPELYAADLEKNQTMRESIYQSIQNGIPFIAECGGYLYLGKDLDDMNGQPHSMVGVFPFSGKKQNRLERFGYVEVKADWPIHGDVQRDIVRAHEFHYYETFLNGTHEGGNYFQIQKADQSMSWSGGYRKGAGICGFPHFNFCSNIELFRKLLDTMAEK